MKKTIFISVSALFIFCMCEISYCWDSTAAKYMPLQVGNIWVYYGESHQQFYTGSSKIKVNVYGVLDTLGKRYYKLNKLNIIISGNGGDCGLLPQLIRIDSATMNICSPGYNCYSNELIVDSLNSQKNDTSVRCPYTYKICIDKSSYSIFNSSFSSKLFTNERGNSSIRYLKTIGPSNIFWGEAGNWCFTNLTGCVINGVVFGDTSMIVGLQQINVEVPSEFKLSQNYPNPFNPVTKIKFDVRGSSESYTLLYVYDVLGKEVAVLVDQQLQPGTYEADWDASAYPSGVYYYRIAIQSDKLDSDYFTETKKMVLIK